MTSLYDGISTEWILAILAVLLTIYFLCFNKRSNAGLKNLPPYPSPPSFLIGHMGQMAKDCRRKMRSWKTTAGNLYSLDFAGQRYIVVNGYQTFKEVLVDHAHCVLDVPTSFMNSVLNEHNKGIAESNGENWVEQRAVATSILRSLGMGKNVLAERIQAEVSVYLQALSGYDERPVDVRMLTSVSISNIICSIIVGRRFEHDDPYFVHLLTSMGQATKYFACLPILTIFPWLYHLPGDLFKAKKLVAIFKDINQSFSRKHIDDMNASRHDSDNARENFIACYLSEMDRKRKSGKSTTMDEENLTVAIRNLFIAGTDTASANILWFFLYIMHYPDVQEKIYEEISANIGPSALIRIQDRVKLPYLSAAILETQRIACVTPFASPRVVGQEFKVQGYDFPVGALVLPNIDSVQNDQDSWPSPDEFRPERFLDGNGQLIEPEHFIPFSLGRRVCLGESMAKMELFLFLSGVLQKFQLRPPEVGKLPPLQEMFGAISCPQPYQIRFIHRENLMQTDANSIDLISCYED